MEKIKHLLHLVHHSGQIREEKADRSLDKFVCVEI